jgi:hypothetical protein
MAAALNSGEHEAFSRIMETLRLLSPDVATALGW